MFGRKKKSRGRCVMLILFDDTSREIFTCPINEYVLPDEVVLALSVEYFNDPDPCEIHRGAVHNRVMMELMDNCTLGTTYSIADLPAAMRIWFPVETAFIRLAE